MGIGSIVGGVVGAIGGIANIFDDSAEDAAKAQEAATRRMEARIDMSVSDLEELTDTYYKDLAQINNNFDPFNMEEAYGSFYEGVILPMERDFAEYMLPSITAAYSGGLFGPESYNSGARKEAELRARQSLTEKKGELRHQERETNINRNLQLDARSRDVAKDKLQAGTLAPNLRAGTASDIFKGEQAAIETRYAADRSALESILNVPSAITAGATAGGSIQEGINRVFGSKETK